jgi:hypothetical protein
MSIDERTLLSYARLLEMNEFGDFMSFLSGHITNGEFTANRLTTTENTSQINVTFTNAKKKRSVTLNLHEQTDSTETLLVFSKLLFQLYTCNSQLHADLRTSRKRVEELSSKRSGALINPAEQHSTTAPSSQTKVENSKALERVKMSLINPVVKRRRAATGVTYGEENDSD